VNWHKGAKVADTRTRNVSDAEVARIWGTGYRLFLSHKSTVKAETAILRDRLQNFGVSGFVAHTDIHPTLEWQNEIENALATMDGFAALITKDFRESDWTDQEIGYALSRGVPIVPVYMGTLPYGFIGKLQALFSEWSNAPSEIVRALIRHDKMLDAYIEALRGCQSFDDGNVLATVLSAITSPSHKQVDALVSAVNENFELRGSFGFNGNKPATYGPGLASHLTKLFGPRFDQADDGRIRIKPRVI
jgi:hypothetical protein